MSSIYVNHCLRTQIYAYIVSRWLWEYAKSNPSLNYINYVKSELCLWILTAAAVNPILPKALYSFTKYFNILIKSLRILNVRWNEKRISSILLPNIIRLYRNNANLKISEGSFWENEILYLSRNKPHKVTDRKNIRQKKSISGVQSKADTNINIGDIATDSPRP